MWQIGAQLGMSLLSGYAARGAQEAQNIVSRAEAAAQNKVREGRNEVAAAEGSLARWMQSENNNRRLRAAGENMAAGTQTLIRMQDATTTGSIEDQLRAAEAAGAYAANAASTGVGGNAVDIIDLTSRMRTSRMRAAKERNSGYVNYDTIQQIAGIMPQAIEGLDISSVNTGLDFSTNHASTKRTGNALMDMLGSGALQNALKLSWGSGVRGTTEAGVVPGGSGVAGFSGNNPSAYVAPSPFTI